MSAEFVIHFKSISGDIITLPFSPEKSIKQFRDEIATRIRLEQGNERPSECITLFHEDLEQNNENYVPVLEQDHIYNYFIREDHTIRYQISIEQGSPARDETQQIDEESLGEIYYRYDLQVICLSPSLEQPRLVQEFSIYYNPRLRLFFHQDYIQIVRPGATPYHTSIIRLLGHHADIGMPLFALAYQYLDTPWSNRSTVAQLVQIEWRNLEELYLDEIHFRDFPQPI